MFDFIIYLGQSALCLAALYLIYKVAMSHETLHYFNRVLLLGSVLLSALLPLCRVKIVKEYNPEPTLASIEIDDMVVADVADVALGIDYVSLLKDLAVMIFLVGVVFMLVRLAVGIYSVWRLIHSGPMSVITDDVTLTVVSRLSSPFSWFGHIVASESDMQEYRPMILAHELAHIRLRHSWDVMFVDFALCLWWFNPAMWLLRRELQSLHEYQADDAVLNGGVDAKNYQMMLIKRAVGSRLHSVANCLNHSNLNNRITMMCKKNSSRWAATKALLVVPMVAVAMGAFATTVYVPREVQDKVTENSVNNKDSKKSVLKISGEKIYLDNEQIAIDQLKERVHAYNEISLQADSNTYMGVVADVKNVLRENEALKLTYEQTDETPKPIYIVAGKVVSAEDISKIDPATIGNMSVLKDKSAKEFVKELGLDISEEDVNNGVVVIRLKKDGDTVVSAEATKGNIVIVDKSSAKKVSLREALQMNLRPVEGLYGVAKAEVTVNPDGSFDKVNINCSNKEEDKDLTPLVNEVSRALHSAIKRAELPAKKTTYNYDISFCIQTDDGVLSSKVPVGSDAIVVMAYAEKQNSQQDDKPFIKVEKMPTFNGGKSLVGFQNWIQYNIRYPQEAIEKGIGGRVIFQFVVERDGTPSSFNVLQSPDKSLADEVERIFKTSPKWEAGEQGGKKVRVLYTCPVVFTTPSTVKQEFEQKREEFEQKREEFEQKKQEFEQKKQELEQNKDLVYIKVEKMPTFQGGDLNAFRNWMQGQIQYPAEAAAKNISGRVIFSFVVEKDGSTSDFTVLQTPDKLLADEVERIFKTCPKWEPGTQRGEKVRVKYTVPIVFAVQK